MGSSKFVFGQLALTLIQLALLIYAVTVGKPVNTVILLSVTTLITAGCFLNSLKR